MNIFTKDDYRKIQAWLKANSIKDSDLTSVNDTIPEEDTLVLVQKINGILSNVKISIKNLLNSTLSKVIIDTIIANAVKVNNTLTVTASNVKIDNEKGTTLQDVLDYFEGNKLNRHTDDTFDGNLTVKKNITIEGNIKSHDDTITVEADLEATGEITDGQGNMLSDVNDASKGWKIEYQDPQQDEPTVRAKYVLKDYRGVPKGSTIKIYKDSAITNVYLGTVEDTCNPNTGEVTKHPIHDNNEALSIVYRLDTGKYSLVNVPIKMFATEAEFDKYRGLGVTSNGQIFIKLASDVESSNYLHFNELGEITADGIETRILRDLGNIITSIAGDGTMWGVYKEHEGTQETSTPNDGSRWGEFKRAEEIREQLADSTHQVFADNWDAQDDDPELPQDKEVVDEASYAYNWKTTDTPASDNSTEGNLKDLYQKTLNQDKKFSELDEKVNGIKIVEFSSIDNHNPRFEFPIAVGQTIKVTNLSSISCSCQTFNNSNYLVEIIKSPIQPNESIEFTATKNATHIGGYIGTLPYKILIEYHVNGLVDETKKIKQNLVSTKEKLNEESTRIDLIAKDLGNSDGFTIKMCYDKGSSFVIGKASTVLTLKCALHISKVGTQILKGIYNIDTIFTFDNSKFSFLLLNISTGNIYLSNSDVDVYNKEQVMLLALTPTLHISGHLSSWAYSQISRKELNDNITILTNEVKKLDFDINGNPEIVNLVGTTAGITAKFDYPLYIGEKISITNKGTTNISVYTYDDTGENGVYLFGINAAESAEYIAVANTGKLGGYSDAIYNIEVKKFIEKGIKEKVTDTLNDITILKEDENKLRTDVEGLLEKPSDADCYFQFHGHPFYSHSLILIQNANQIIPCMSIYDVNMAARLGFKFIEPSGAYTSDDIYLCNHLVSKNIGGVNKLVFAGGVKYKGTDNPANDFAVNEKTAAWIRENCCYYSKYEKYESFIPTLEEFCLACRQNNIGVFLSANRDSDIETALSIVGPDNLVIYSSNIPKLIEWRKKYGFITMMYYDSTGEDNYQLSSVVSRAESIGKPLLYCLDITVINKLTDSELKTFVYTMHDKGFIVGAATCYMLEWQKIQRVVDLGFDVFGSDGEMNDFVGNTIHQIGDIDFSDFNLHGSYSTDSGDLILQDSSFIHGGDISSEPKVNFLCKSLLRIKFAGTLRVWVAGSHNKNNNVEVTSDGTKYLTFSDFGIEKPFSFYLTSIGETRIHYIEFNGSVC